MKNRKTVEKEDHVAEVKNFLREVKDYQDRLRHRAAQRNEETACADHDDEPEEEIVVPPKMRPFIDKEINFDLFLEMLTERVDEQRVRLTPKQFNEIEFTQHGLPHIVLEIMCFLTRATKESIMHKKLEQLVPELMGNLKKRKSERIENMVDEQYSKEVLEMKRARLNFGKYIQFQRYEQFFRLFCRNPYVEHHLFLRADLKSFSRGIKKIYGGKENNPLAELIFNYLGKGLRNHLITFSEFLNFVREFQLEKANQQVIVFRMISDRKKELTITCLTRNLVSTPRGSAFANELKAIMKFYSERL